MGAILDFEHEGIWIMLMRRFSALLVTVLLIGLAVCAPRCVHAAGIDIITPQNNAEISGDSFELSWRCDPSEVGTAVAILLNSTVIDSYYQNAEENHITVKVPMALANTPYTLRVASYWQMSYAYGTYTPAYWGSITVKFKDSCDYLEPSVVSGQSGTTFTVTWRGHPEYTGTALRIDLWQNGSFVKTIGYTWNYTTVEGIWSGPMPHVDRGDGYMVRIASIYREWQGRPGDPKSAASDIFSLSPLPYVQVLAPSSNMIWNGGSTHHVLWASDPIYFGTAARVELWRNNRFYMTLGYKFDCAEENDLAIVCPWVEQSSFGSVPVEYKVRVVSLWLEEHPHTGIPAYDFGVKFLISSLPHGSILYPQPLSQWAPEANGKFRIDYTSDPTLAGSAVRFDLWKGNSFFKTVGYNWDNQTTNSVFVDDPRVSADSSYYIRVVSLWLEQHPTPGVPTFIESLQPVNIVSKPPFNLLYAAVDYDGASLWLQLGWHAEWQFVGTNFRLEFWPRTQQVFNEHYVIAYPQSAGDDNYQSFIIPPLPSAETFYYVRLKSYWQESIQGPYQGAQDNWWVIVPDLR
jgi:hypothetical protein